MFAHTTKITLISTLSLTLIASTLTPSHATPPVHSSDFLYALAFLTQRRKWGQINNPRQ